MGTDVLNNYLSIEEELERAKNNLKGLNENIRRIIGRDVPDIQLRGDRKRTFNNDQRRSLYNSNDRNRNRDGSPPSSKRRQSMPEQQKSVFSRLSGPPIRGGGLGASAASTEDEPKPKITSRVIKELPTRQEIVAAQGGDAASRARNRRMFGSLLGTLQKFCQEESRLKQKEEKKAQIEKKLEDQEKKERENMRKERQDLFTNRKRQQMEIKMLETKMTRMKELSIWEESKKPLMNFVRTKAKPKIYYLPKVINKKVEKKLADNKADIEKSIQKKRNELEEELATIANRFKTNDKIQDNGMDKLKDDEATATKHDRRGNQEDEEDDDHYNDSVYNSDENNDGNRSLGPDVTIVKQEVPSVNLTKIDDCDEYDDDDDDINVEKINSSPQSTSNQMNDIKTEDLLDEIVTLPTAIDSNE